MTEPPSLCTLLNQQHYVTAAHTLLQHIEAMVPVGPGETRWRGAASDQYRGALLELHQSVVAARAWLENARTDLNLAIAEATSA